MSQNGTAPPDYDERMRRHNQLARFLDSPDSHGMNTAQIAEAVGIGTKAVGRALRERGAHGVRGQLTVWHGAPASKRRPGTSRAGRAVPGEGLATVQGFLQLHADEEFTLSEVAERTGVPRTTVFDAFKGLGWTPLDEQPQAAGETTAVAGQLYYIGTTRDGTLIAQDEDGVLWPMVPAGQPL